MDVFPFLQIHDLTRPSGRSNRLRRLPDEPVQLQDPAVHASNQAPKDPIFEAVEQGDSNNLLEVLTKHNAHFFPLYTDSRKWTAYHLAASKPEYKECLEVLLMYEAYGSIPFCKIGRTCEGETLLHIACDRGCDENALLLLRKGWSPEMKTCAGSTALHLAASSGCVKIVRHLLNYRANVNAGDARKCTPLHLSAKLGNSDVCGILLENGANSLSFDGENNLPLHLACKYGTFETACLLLERHPASINHQNTYGITPFMLAVDNFDVQSIQYLLKIGARTDICDKRGRFALCFIPSLDRIENFSLLLQSTDMNYIQQFCVSNTIIILRMRPDYSFSSCTCLTIEKGHDFLNALVNSRWPRSILQMPSLQCRLDISGVPLIKVVSPLAYLFFRFVTTKFVAFDRCLGLLLKYKIIMMDEFQSVLKTNWPNSNVQFINPLSIVLTSLWPNDNREHYFCLLIANNVTTDYCLQCYHNNDQPFATFNKYHVHYCLVIYAVEKFNIEVVKLLISNSVILEPDILCNYLIMAYTKNQNHSSKDAEEARNLYRYLITLKPVYFKWDQPFEQYDFRSFPFMPAAEQICDEELAKFCGTPYNFQQSPIFAVPDSLLRQINPIPSNLQPFPYVTPTEEFATITLQQLCRTAIRQQLREPTLADNLRNFKRKLLGLPLPNSLKDYLLFKN